MFAYSGWSGAMMMVRREVVERRGWITENQLARSLVYSQLLPGSTAIGIISGSGFRILGWPGLIVATIAYILPPAILMTALSVLYFHYHTVPSLGAPLNGIYAALSGLLLANAWQLARKYNRSNLLWVFTGAAMLANIFLHLNYALIVIAAGIISILLLSPERKEESDA